MELNSLELDPALVKLAKSLKQDALRWVLGGGEDFELVFAANPRHRIHLESLFEDRGLSARRVGRIVQSPGLTILGDERYCDAEGFTHFAGTS